MALAGERNRWDYREDAKEILLFVCLLRVFAVLLTNGAHLRAAPMCLIEFRPSSSVIPLSSYVGPNFAD
jgi:hypothetical protein